MSTTVTNPYTEHVRRGVTFLDAAFLDEETGDWRDEEAGDWRDRIDVDTLDVREACGCILGQVFRDVADEAGEESGYIYARDAFTPDGDDPIQWSRDHGFGGGYDDVNMDELQEAWVDELNRVRQ